MNTSAERPRVAANDTFTVATSSSGATSERSARLGIRSASATVLVDRLVAADHLRREADPHDGRRVTLAVTDHARDEVRAALGPLIERIIAITDRLDDEQRATVREALDEIGAAMREYAEPDR